MPNSPVILLICAACVAFASNNPVHKSSPNKNQIEHRGASDALASSFNVNVKNGVQFKLDVKNNTKRMTELRFPSGMTHEFIVFDESGKEVWRSSSGRMFTQMTQAKLVKSNDSAEYAAVWNGRNAHGKFTAVAILSSENHPVQERVEFSLK